MLLHYIKLALRNLKRFGLYTFINITGLSIGIAVSLTILLYVSHELQYDKFHQRGKEIYRVNGTANWGGSMINLMSTSFQFAPIVKENNGNIINYVRISIPEKHIIESDASHRFYEDLFAFSDTSFFSVFTFPLVKGQYTALSRPNTVIVTETAARKYFGEDDPMGKTILYDKNITLEVTGVAKDFPSNSTIKYDFIASNSTLATLPNKKKELEHAYVSLGNTTTYLLLNNADAAANVEQTIASLVATSINEKFTLIPLLDTHTALGNADSSTGKYMSLFVGIALIILILALINYMSLTTARASIRAKEVGVRKVTGAKRSTLAMQFYVESAVMTVAAFALAIIFIQLFLPPVMNVLQLKIDAGFIWNTTFIWVMITLLLACILLSGSYPALVLSRFMPARILKGKSGNSASGHWIRRGFTVFQFTASIALIICSLVVQYQLDYLQTKKVGLNKEQVMVLNLDPSTNESPYALINDLRLQSGIVNVAAASSRLYTTGTNGMFIQTPKNQKDVFINMMSIDEQFFNTLGVTWRQQTNGSVRANTYIINEAALTDLQITTDDLNQPLEIGGVKSYITGIVKDFNYTSLHHDVKGILFNVQQDTARSLTKGGAIYIRLDPASQLKEKMATVETVFHKHQPQAPFSYYFLDDAFNKLYQSEDRLARIFTAFTSIALMVACLGLFGLVTFAAETRTKEIGIRKVLGASLNSIVVLLSTEFLLLIIVSVAIASPLAYEAMHNWLSDFPYRVSIPLSFFGIAGASALIVAGITVGVQAFKAGNANPVKALRSE